MPVTYPGAGDVLVFIRGHEAETDDTSGRRLGAARGSDRHIVCFASARQLAAIVRKLVANGKSPDEPAALIYHGTMPEQKTIDGSLADVAEEAARSQLRRRQYSSLAPWPACAITFAGSTNVRSSAAGSSSRVHASRQASLSMLEDLGAEAIEAPAIRIVSPDDMTALDQAAADASSYDWIVFTSANGSTTSCGASWRDRTTSARSAA